MRNNRTGAAEAAFGDGIGWEACGSSNSRHQAQTARRHNRGACLLLADMRHCIPQEAGLFDGSIDDQQLLQRLSQCMSDDERARLGTWAIECGSKAAVAAAGADAIAAMSGALAAQCPSEAQTHRWRTRRQQQTAAELPADTGSPAARPRMHSQASGIDAGSAGCDLSSAWSA